ncbi:MAG TPA: hypothetical protein VG055_27235 [Planctomycetaceae bacterium]|nr:hypothetical protein [Planctomycetaceae bacterium]
MIATLEGVAESQQRIDTAVAGIESTQLGTLSVLTTMQHLSMATFGLTALSAGLMLWRFNALNKAIDQLSRQLRDLESHHDAQEKSKLLKGLQYLDYEEKNESSSLDKAYDQTSEAAFIYGQLVANELHNEKRVPLLNYRGRCYLLALLSELECDVLRGDLKGAQERAESQKPLLRDMVTTTFRETVGKAPDVYLSPELSGSGITLALMTELYQQLQQAGALGNVEIHDACCLFEHLRGPIFHGRTGLRRFWAPLGRAKEKLVQNLRYLIACVEDTNRIESLRLMINESTQGRFDLRALRGQIQTWRNDQKAQRPDSPTGTVLAYSLL